MTSESETIRRIDCRSVRDCTKAFDEPTEYTLWSMGEDL